MHLPFDRIDPADAHYPAMQPLVPSHPRGISFRQRKEGGVLDEHSTITCYNHVVWDVFSRAHVGGMRNATEERNR